MISKQDEQRITGVSKDEINRPLSYQIIQDNNGNFSQKINQSTEKDDYFVLFLDPESLMYYRKYVNRNDYIRIEPIENTHLANHYLERNMKQLGLLRKQLNLEKFSWNFKEADLYRRRPFPIEFL